MPHDVRENVSRFEALVQEVEREGHLVQVELQP